MTANRPPDQPPPVRVQYVTPRDLARRLNAEAPGAASTPLGVPSGVSPAAPLGEPLDAPLALVPPAPLPPLRARLARGDRVPMLLFAVGGERFLLPLSDVREACDAPTVHPVPRMTGATRGVMAVRGSLVPVKDPAGVLGVAAAAGAAALLVIADTPLALLVDDVLDAVDLTADQLHPLPSRLSPDDLLLGAAPAGGRLAAVLDLPPLLLALDLSDR